MNQEVKTKKLINAPENIIAEMIEGMVGAHPDMLRVEGSTGRAVVGRRWSAGRQGGHRRRWRLRP